ncbi:hypothetical protein AB0C59_07645 [Streptomyces sp. NPDC048664]|uniref:hypothetical protein n=1 Tax=Streptomyces sp. NPDC048664 TaxID=3154505 RepID=UPI00342BB390
MSRSRGPASGGRGGGRARRGLLLLSALGLLAGATACNDGGGDGAWEAPGKGQAAVLLDRAHSGALDLGDDFDGLTTASDGSVYVLRSGDGIQRVARDRTVKSSHSGLRDASGLVALPDGSLVFGQDDTVEKLDRAGHVSALAGATGPRFSDGAVTAVGVRPDGELIVIDAHTVWSLTGKLAKRVYQVPADERRSRHLFPTSDLATVGPGGSIYVGSGPPNSGTVTPGEIIAIHADGSVAPLALPRSVAGLQGSPADLRVGSFTADGADGIYTDAYDDAGTYVLHLHAGRAELVARHLRSKDTENPEDCLFTHPVDAKNLPCDLPSSITYGAGKLVLGGHTNHLLQIGIM